MCMLCHRHRKQLHSWGGGGGGGIIIILTTRIENVRTFLGRAKLLMDEYLLHNNNIFLITVGGS